LVGEYAAKILVLEQIEAFDFLSSLFRSPDDYHIIDE
jgi:hypothetical protein